MLPNVRYVRSGRMMVVIALALALTALSETLGTGTATAATFSGDVFDNCPELSRAMTGDCVSKLQEALSSQGFFTYIDGIYGPETAQSVTDYQDRRGIARTNLRIGKP